MQKLEISFVSCVTNAATTTTTTISEGSKQAALYIHDDVYVNVAVAVRVSSGVCECLCVCACAENIRQSIIHNKGAHESK